MKSNIRLFSIFLGLALSVLLIPACSIQVQISNPPTPTEGIRFGPTEAWGTIQAIQSAYPNSPTEQSIKMTEAMSTTLPLLITPESTQTPPPTLAEAQPSPATDTATPTVTQPRPATDTPTPTAAPAEVLASNQVYSHSLIVDDQMVYWASCDSWESEHGLLMAYSKNRKTVSAVASGIACPFFPQADQGSLYWMDRQQTGTGMHNIVSLAKGGGQPMVLSSGENMDRLLAVDETYVYWGTKNGEIMRLSKAGQGAPEVVPLPGGNRTTLDGADAYWFNAQGDLIRSAKDGSAAVTLVLASDFASSKVGERLIQRGLGQVFPGAVDVYFTAYSDGNVGMVSCTDNHTRLLKISKNGGAYQLIADLAGSVILLIAEPYAYFGGACQMGISRVNLDTKVVEPFANNTGAVGSLASDDKYIYWVDMDSGMIKRAPRPVE